MRSEFQFFMSENDETEFVSSFASLADALKRESDTQWWFCIGDCRVQFLRSKLSDDQITLGRIAVATHGTGEACSRGPLVEGLFKKMRTWLKKRYTNRLMAENIEIPGSATSYRLFWLGPDAAAMFRNGRVTLRSLFSGPVVFKEE